MNNIIKKIRIWYQGRYIEPENDPNSMVIRLAGHYEQPLLAKSLNMFFSFWAKNWKVLLPVIIGTAVTLFIHFDSKTTGKTEHEKQKQNTNIVHITTQK